MLVTRDGHILVSEMGAGRIVRLSPNGFDLVADGLEAPIGLRELPDGDLLVAEEPRNSLSRVRVATGERIPVADGLGAVTYLTMGPDGAAYVSSFREVAPTMTGVVHRVNVETGVSAPFATGMHVPEGLFFDEAGRLLVAEWHLPSAILRFGTGGGGRASATAIADGFDNIYGLLSDGEGGVLVGDHGGRIVRVRSDGAREVLLEGIGRPGGLAFSAEGDLLIAEFVDFGATGYLIRLRGSF